MTALVLEALIRAIRRLEREDGCLFEYSVAHNAPQARKLHEVCINHRLALILEAELLAILATTDRLYVDIEFNREGPYSKSVNLSDGEKLVRPDIIVHNRKSGPDKRNVLVVECKKEGRRGVIQDRRKIHGLMTDSRYEYQYGLQVVYRSNDVTGQFFHRDRGVVETVALPSSTHQGDVDGCSASPHTADL